MTRQMILGIGAGGVDSAGVFTHAQHLAQNFPCALGYQCLHNGLALISFHIQDWFNIVLTFYPRTPHTPEYSLDSIHSLQSVTILHTPAKLGTGYSGEQWPESGTTGPIKSPLTYFDPFIYYQPHRKYNNRCPMLLQEVLPFLTSKIDRLLSE